MTTPNIQLKNPNKRLTLHVPKTKNIKNCPCCSGNAELSDMKIKKSILWQVYCKKCGMNSELDTDVHYSVKCWNTRSELTKEKSRSLILIISIPIAFSLAFFLGFFISYSMMH